MKGEPKPVRKSQTPLAKYIRDLLDAKSRASNTTLRGVKDQDIAKQLGMASSAFSRALKDGKLTMPQCFRLAAMTGGNLLSIFKLVNKDWARLAEPLLQGKEFEFSLMEQEYLKRWRRATDVERALLIAYLDAIAADSVNRASSSPRRRAPRRQRAPI